MMGVNQVCLKSVAKLMLEKYAKQNIKFQFFFNVCHLMLSNLTYTMIFLIIGILFIHFLALSNLFNNNKFSMINTYGELFLHCVNYSFWFYHMLNFL